MPSYEKYTFPVGATDEMRLQILNRVCNPFTERFQKVHLPDLKSKFILDLGCGTGILTCYWAKEVGPEGHVTAVDCSEEQIEVAKKNAKKLNLNNINFLVLDVRNLLQLKTQFDLVYSRFLLTHLHEAKKVLNDMSSLVKPKGFLFCEEVSSLEGGSFADPDSKVYWERKHLLLKRYQIHGNASPEIGRTLYSSFHTLGLNNVHAELCQPIITREEDKAFFLLGFTPQLKSQLIEKGLTTSEEFDRIAQETEKEIMHKTWLGTISQHIQVLGQKSG